MANMDSFFTAARERLRWLWHRLGTTWLFTEVLHNMRTKAWDLARLTRIDRPIGIYLLLWPVLWALWMSADGHPDPRIFVIFVAGVIITRSAGCVINDYADRNFDAHVRRTRDRPLATGRVTPAEALALFAALGLIGIGLMLTLNRLALLLALVGAGLIVTYPFFKRFFALPQAYLGMAFAWSVPMAYAAQAQELSRVTWLLFAACILWTTAYDTMYAMADREDDLKIGIKSSAILFGDADRLIIGIMQAMSLYALWLAGSLLGLGLWYRLGLGAATLFALYEQWLIRDRHPDACLRAFLHNHYFGMAVFIGIMLEYTFRG